MVCCQRGTDSDLVAAYNVWTRLRMGYMGPATAVVLTMMAVGGAVQTFASIFNGEQGTTVVQTAVVLFVIPVLFVVFAVMAELCIDLAMDAIDYPPLTNTRAVLMVGFGLSEKTTDIFLFCLLEGLGLVNAVKEWILSDFEADQVIVGYAEGGFFAILILCILRAGLRFKIQRNSQLDEMVKAAKGLQSSEVFSSLLGEGRQYKPLGDPEGGPTEDKRGSRDIEVGEEKATDNKALSWLVAGLLLLLAVFVPLVTVTDREALVNFAPVVMVGISAAMACFSKVKEILGPSRRVNGLPIFIGVFMLTTVGLAVVSVHFMPVPYESLDPIIGPPSGSHIYKGGDYDDAYPICTARWGRAEAEDKHKLLALDLTLFADAMYGATSKVIRKKLVDATKGTDLDDMEIVYIEEEFNVVGRWAVVKFPKAKVQALLIRGTSSARDALADVDLWASASVAGIFDKVVHVLGIFPVRTIRNIMRFLVISRWFDTKNVWMPSVEMAMELKKNGTKTGYASVIVGHSLGGGLAATAGALAKVPTLAISPPGALYSMGRFAGRGFDEGGVLSAADYERRVTVIQPFSDPVPMVDKQVGMVQKIECGLAPVPCHMTTSTLSTLFESCRDPRGRKFPVGGGGGGDGGEGSSGGKSTEGGGGDRHAVEDN